MDPLAVLRTLEPTFKEAGQLAFRMQQGVRSYNKKDTGNSAGDIVTEADLAVQDFLLEKMAKTDLVQCRLLAEEDTPATSLFNPQGTYYLGIDPIDDTAIYAKGGDHFSTMISLHDGKRILYVFAYFPAWDWTHRVVENAYSNEGEQPSIAMPSDAESAIVYWSGDPNPEEILPQAVLQSIKERGLRFETTKRFAGTPVSIGPFITNKVGGVYHANMNAYDGFVEMSIAEARGQKVFANGVDLSDVRKRELGFYYPGYYLALNEALSKQY